jgi:hypothetical protein
MAETYPGGGLRASDGQAARLPYSRVVTATAREQSATGIQHRDRRLRSRPLTLSHFDQRQGRGIDRQEQDLTPARASKDEGGGGIRQSLPTAIGGLVPHDGYDCPADAVRHAAHPFI